MNYRYDRAKRHWLLRERLDFYRDMSGGPNACWPWQAYRMPNGYGQLGWKKKLELAHRLAYAEAHNLLNTNGSLALDRTILVLHSCDNPPCCNPAHLSLGNKKKNAEEARDRGLLKILKGEDAVNSKLTESQVLAIRFDERAHREIAADYGVGKTIIGSIKNRTKWKHL